MTDKVFNGSAKDYAVSLGIGTGGRGRPSRDQMDAIAAARAEGWTFTKEGAKPAKPVTVEAGKTEISIKEKAPKPGKDLRTAAPRTSPDGAKWQGMSNGKTITASDATVCTNCGVSLGWHTCNTPKIVFGGGDLIPVSILG